MNMLYLNTSSRIWRMCFVSKTLVHHATPTPQTQTKWLLCKILLAVKVCVFDFNHHCALKRPSSGVSHTPWPKSGWLGFSERKRNSYSSKTKLDVRFAVDSQPGTFVALHAQSWSSVSSPAFSLNTTAHIPEFPERAIDSGAKVASAALISAALEDSPSATSAIQWRAGSPQALDFLGPLQRAVNSC